MTAAPAVAVARLNARHWFVFAVCSVGFFFDSMDLQIMSLVAPQLLREWSLSPQQVGLITSAGMVGMLIGSVLFGVFSDRVGRRPGIQLTIAVFACFSALGALAQDPAQLMVCRVLAGLGIGGFVPIDTALMSEFVPARWRGRLIALWAIAFPAGGLAAAGLVPLVLPAFGWRGAFLLGFAPVVLIPVVRAWLPETPRFLASTGKVEQARRSLAWISPGEALPDIDPAPATGSSAGLFAPAQRRGTALASLLWFAWSFAYFGIILWLPTLLVLMRVPLAEVFLYTLGFQLAAIAGRAVTLLFADRVSRPAMVVVTGLCAAAAMLVFGAQHTMLWLVVAGYALSFCQDGGFSGIVPYTPELFPTRLRATGVGWANGTGRLASLIAPLLTGALVQAGSAGTVFIVFAACYAGAVAVVLLLGKGTRRHLSQT
ncbi:MFS transporter [Kutzneria sp. CA-103260]|uniref:MFS transporter n=1 Tax=Kutzneria sp. CA-103260 TaxID=2802641 RepID=UPI001BA963B1|nr:MFS transporter [Kutzneria sp. CA-103260]QUQ66620.1 MFS transporter [Kutzneria sp. CA-103260]